MRVDRERLKDLIPHKHAMCLLDGVRNFDDETIVCISDSHRRRDHPLARAGELSAVHAVEYGAQAVAAHVALTADSNNDSLHEGYLVALRDVHVHCARLDTLRGTLTVTARQLLKDEEGGIYEFQVTAEGRAVANGRVTIMHKRESQG